jgi:hypothetical protein
MPEYSPSNMRSWLKKYFEETYKGYEVKENPEDLRGIRVALHCIKKEDEKIVDEIVVDIITTSEGDRITKEKFFPTVTIEGIKIIEASPIRFYQYYFPYAKIYLAFPDYATVEEDVKSSLCEKRGIGLIKVSPKEIKIEVKASFTLFEDICNNFYEKINPHIKERDKNRVIPKISKSIESYVNAYLHYLLYYPCPQYKLREITGRTVGDISLLLTDKMNELNNIKYREELKKLNYRRETREDYIIALDTVKKLWNDYIGIEYPEFQKEFEPVLMLNPKYRDHFLHQFQVFLLGAYIIDKLYKETAIQNFNNTYGCQIENVWLVGSIYHDFNYNIQQYEEWTDEFFKKTLNIKENPSFLKLENSFVRESFLFKIKEFCEAMKFEMDPDTMMFFYEKTINKKDHGLLSALSLLKLFEEKSNSSKLNNSALIQSALAILLHNEDIWKVLSGECDNNSETWEKSFAQKKIMQNLLFREYPLIFLLIFCDIIQEWGRVGKNYEEAKAQLEKISIDSNEILIGISVEKDTDYNNKQIELQGVKRFLKDPRFKIDLVSRRGGLSAQIPMQGE